MSLSDIGKLKSTLGGGTVDDNLPRLRVYEEKAAPTYMAKMQEHLAEHGQQDPLTVHKGALEDGHHRVIWAQNLGLPGLNVRKTGS